MITITDGIVEATAADWIAHILEDSNTGTKYEIVLVDGSIDIAESTDTLTNPSIVDTNHTNISYVFTIIDGVLGYIVTEVNPSLYDIYVIVTDIQDRVKTIEDEAVRQKIQDSIKVIF